MDILHKLWGGGHRLCYKPTLPHNKMVGSNKEQQKGQKE
jgi:hypothetical protein